MLLNLAHLWIPEGMYGIKKNCHSRSGMDVLSPPPPPCNQKFFEYVHWDIIRTQQSQDRCHLVPFVQFKKREKHPWRSFTFSKVAGFRLQSAIFTKSNTPSWVLLTFLKLNKCYQIAQSVSYDKIKRNCLHPFKILQSKSHTSELTVLRCYYQNIGSIMASIHEKMQLFRGRRTTWGIASKYHRVTCMHRGTPSWN